MADGNHWQKKIADAALGALGTQDYCGVIHWDGPINGFGPPERNGIAKIQAKIIATKMKARIDRMVPGDMPGFDSTLTNMFNNFNNRPPKWR